MSGNRHICKGIIIVESVFFLILLSFFHSCSHSKFEGYSEHENRFFYKLIQIGESKNTPKINDFLTIEFAYRTIEDSLFYKGMSKVQLTPPDYIGGIDNCFATLCEGDSTSFIIEALPFFSKTLQSDLPSFLDSSSYFKVDVRLFSFQKYEDYLKQKKEFLAWIADFGEYEKVFLQHYIEERNLDTLPKLDGYYKVLMRSGTGLSPQKGDTVAISYNGRFLNGTFFDKGKEGSQNFEFVFGTEWQVIDGVERAIKGMKEGEKSLFIMPSNLAFGAKGSSSGIVPPYTSVIYELELNKVLPGDTVGKIDILNESEQKK